MEGFKERVVYESSNNNDFFKGAVELYITSDALVSLWLLGNAIHDAGIYLSKDDGLALANKIYEHFKTNRGHENEEF